MINILISGILRGGMYVLIALGLALVYGVMGIPNFAHGEYYLIGAYAAYFALTLFGVSPVIAIIFAALIGFVFGAVIEKITFAPLRKRNTGDWVTNAFMIGAGIQLIIQNLAQYLFTANYFGVTQLWEGSIKLGSINISYDRLVAFAIAMCTLAAFWLFLKKTRTGISILAVADDEVGAMLMGVDIKRIHTLTYAMGSMLAALAGGALISITPAYPTMGTAPNLAAWFTVILVGVGNLSAVAVGGFMVGLIEVFATYFFGAAWQNVVSLIVIIMILLFKPNGLFGRKQKV
ncbi:MAG: branched-chain amino acid ABC transporter permease [Lachnospiraceae bacterium]|nr:branched-chain amino acid ABC transporter permease [Lachnospiraceae bacterium]